MEQTAATMPEEYEKFQKEQRVSHPSHYTWLKDKCGCEVIDITRHLSYNKGTAVAYILRSGHKEEEGYTILEKEVEDLKKAAWHLNDEIKTLEKKLYNLGLS